MNLLSQDSAQDLLAERLRKISEEAHVPLLSMDLDDTFLPFGQPIGEAELDLLLAYTAAGGHFAFNTLAPKEWLYRRVIERLVNTCSERNRTHLLSRVHWIVSGGSEIFVYDVASRGYRRIPAGPPSSKAAGLLSLLRHLDGPISLLAFFGDRFDDPGNDGNALGVREIPLVYNFGADQPVLDSAVQRFVNLADKGPAAAQRHVAFLVSQLRARPVLTEREPAPLQVPTYSVWRFERQRRNPAAVEVRGPGFLWSWNAQLQSCLSALVRQSKGLYTAAVPRDAAGFTFFWTGGSDAAGGQVPGHWEGRDFATT